MKITLFSIIFSLLLMSCGNKKKSTVDTVPTDVQNETAIIFKNTGHELVYNMVQKVGDYSKLLDKKDVIYTYTYQTPDGKKDVVTEQYMFNGELSYGAYNTHERTLAELDGLVEQGYDGSEFWLKHNGNLLENESYIKKVVFNRITNFYWFSMMPKLLDDGVNYEYLGEKSIDGKQYNIVNITFNSIENEATDTYQVFINKKTAMVDQFLFTVADFDVIEHPYLMILEYENIEDILLPTKRKYKQSTWDAEVLEGPWIEVTWSDIKFNNDLKKDDFKK